MAAMATMTMATEDMVLDILKNRGYDAVLNTVTKNGVEMKGITIRTQESNIAPNIYLDDFVKRGMSPDVIADKIAELTQQYKIPDFDVMSFLNPEFVKNNCYMTLQKKSTEDVLKRAFPLDDSVEIILRLRVKTPAGAGSIKVTERLLSNVTETLPENVLWQCAQKNTFANTEVNSMINMLSKLTNIDSGIPELPMWVVSNKEKCYGAVNILDKDALCRISDAVGERKLRVFPSSIHECIVIPESFYSPFMSEMVKEVNATVVKPEDVLAERVWSVEI